MPVECEPVGNRKSPIGNPIRVGVAVIVRQGTVLIDRRADGPLAGWWEFPGGKLAAGETVAECIVRECREELGVDVVVGEPLRTLVFDYPHGVVELNFHLCRLADPAAQPRPLQVAELAWVLPAQMADYRFLAANTPVVEELQVRMRA